MWKHDMVCRLCTSGENKTQVHLGHERRTGLNNKKRKIVLWRRITRTLKDLYVNDKDIVYNDTQNTLTNER